MKKKSTIIVIVVAILLIGAVAALILSGKLVVAWNGSSSVNPNVCNTEIVDSFNKAANYEFRDGTDAAPRVDVDGLTELTQRIQGTNGYQSDPTCQVILFTTALETKNIDLAKSATTALKDLHSKRVFPDNNLRTISPLFEYDTTIQYFTTQPSNTTE